MDPLSSISGLASGIQWRDLVDQIVALDTKRKMDPVTNKQSDAQRRLDAWGTWQTLVTKFRDAAKATRNVTAFSQFSVSGGTSPTNGRTLFTASASIDAHPGSYDVEVLALARANKLSGSVQASASTALGLSGEFVINGRTVTATAADSLNTLRDKINALDSGTNPSRVTASVLSTGAAQNRLVLTAEHSGVSGIELVDDAAGTLQALGLVDGTSSLNLAASGGVQSYKVPSATAAIAVMLGVSMPPPSSIIVGGRTITVDLSVDSLSSTVAKIMAAGGNASVVPEATNGTTTGYRLVTDDTVTAVGPDGLRTLEVLGFSKPGRTAVAQVITSRHTYSDASNATAGIATLLTDLKVNSSTLGLSVGDTFTLQGKRGDGSSVNLAFTIGASDTLQTVLDKLNDATGGYGAGTRTAAASLVGGRVVLVDGTAGESQLSLNMSVTQSGGGLVNLGQVGTTTTGRLREMSAGSDAQVRIDGMLISRESNTITDALEGVTLDLQAAELGTISQLTVGRDVGAIARSFGDLAAAYNELVKFRGDQSKPGAALYLDPTLRANMGALTNTLLSSVVGTSGPYTRPGLVGLSLQADGRLSLDANAFSAALSADLASISRLFATSGYATSPDVSYFTSNGKSIPGTYAIDITQVATTPSMAGSGFSGLYADDGTGDTITVAESFSGRSVDVQLDNGDTIDTIVAKLNSAFGTQGLYLTASKSGNDLTITGSQYGTAATFTVSYAAGGTDGTAQLGLAAGTYAGLNVAGTIGGKPASGQGQVLTGAASVPTNPAEGLGILYAGTTIGSQGTIDFVLGASGTLYNAADLIARADGIAGAQQNTLRARIHDLQARADTVQQVLDRRRQSLVAQFIAMEAALSRLQQQSTSLSSFISSMNANNRST